MVVEVDVVQAYDRCKSPSLHALNDANHITLSVIVVVVNLDRKRLCICQFKSSFIHDTQILCRSSLFVRRECMFCRMDESSKAIDMLYVLFYLSPYNNFTTSNCSIEDESQILPLFSVCI